MPPHFWAISHPIHLCNKAAQFLFPRMWVGPSAGFYLPSPTGLSPEEETEAENHITFSSGAQVCLRTWRKVPRMGLCVLILQLVV